MPRFLVATALLAVSATAEAKVQTRSVPYKDGAAELEGFLAWDDAGSDKRPAVLVVHEWWGLNDYAKSRARQLAEMGYVAFAADMFGKGKVTADPKVAGEWAGHMKGDVGAWMARARAALDVLRKHDRVDTKRVAAIGYCFGGSTVLGLAFGGEDLAAVVSFHGGLSVPTPEQAKAVKARMLVCHGADDGFIPADVVSNFRATLDTAKAPYQFVAYPGARHGFTNPGADKYGVDGVKYDKSADEQSWKDMRALLDKVFKPAK